MLEDTSREVRVQYMRPRTLLEELRKLPLVYLPLAPLEWHGPHLVVGVDAINAEQTALALARRIGGVVLPTLYMGTERERSVDVLKSLGLDQDSYVVGMDHPTIKDLYRSFYFPEEVFAIVLRSYIEQCIEHEYRHIFIVNGHGAVNHNEVIKRLCVEFSNRTEGVRVDYSICFPKKLVDEGAIAHAAMEETSLLMHFNQEWVDLDQLQLKSAKLGYADYGIVDRGGFDGHPGAGHAVPDADDPRLASSADIGRQIFDQSIADLEQHVRVTFGIRG